MLERLPVRRHVRRGSLLALLALLMTALAGVFTPAAAQETITQPLDDTQVDFARGTFQRTTVNSGTVAGDPKPFPDQDGALELAPVGVQRPWQVTAPSLPDELAAMGVATIGTRLYTVAGATGAENATAFTEAVYWTSLNQQTGALNPHGLTQPPPGATLPNETWVNDPLPQAVAFRTPAPFVECEAVGIQQRRGPAVASFVTGTGTDFLYSIGGTFNVPAGDCRDVTLATLTSPAVQIGSVNASSGDITWTGGNTQQANYLPTQNLPELEAWTTPTDQLYVSLPEESYGVEGATATIVTTSQATFLYVIGGLISYVDLQGAANMVTPAVFYTKLDRNTGALSHPLGAAGTPWARASNVPLNATITPPTPIDNPGVLGLYGHTTIVSRAVVGTGTGTETRTALYLAGGYTNVSGTQANSVVFRATIANEATGALEWSLSLDPSRPTQIVNTDGSPRGGVAGFAFSNKLYLIGGSSSRTAAPLESISTGVHDDRMALLPLFGDASNPVYFTGSQGDVIDPVDSAGAAVIPALPLDGQTTVENTGWGYAIGGYNAANQPVATIFRGRIGGASETAETTRIPDGWYYSRFFNIRLESENSEARILSVRWFTGIDRQSNAGADLRVEFQRTKLFPCNEAAFVNSPWVALDGDTASALTSKDGFNEVKLRDIFPTEDFNASCFRYRVYATQNGSDGSGQPNPATTPTATPRLFSINVEKIKPGDPDLKLEGFEIGPDASGRMSTFNLRITNLNGDVLSTAPVPTSSPQFATVLCVAYSATDPNVPLEVPQLPIPISSDPDQRVDCAPLYRFVDPTETTPGQVFALNDNWYVNFDNLYPGIRQDQAMVPIQAAFAVPGHYAVAVLIDPYNYVPEGGEGKANNRGENLNEGQPLIRRFTITQAGFVTRTYLPFVSR